VYWQVVTIVLTFAGWVAALPSPTGTPNRHLDTGRASASPRAGRADKPFVDQKRTVGPWLEWNREVRVVTGRTFTFSVRSQGPFGVTLVTAKGYEALLKRDLNSLSKSDLLLTVNSKEATHEGKVTVLPGTYWFILENQTDKTVEFRLQCFQRR
jgi:hypothetical protein